MLTATYSTRLHAEAAACLILRGRSRSRAFDACFEQGDGPAVVRELLDLIDTRPELATAADPRIVPLEHWRALSAEVWR